MIFIFYKVYFVNAKLDKPIQNIENEKITQNKQDGSNLIYDIEYVAEDKKGSKYLIKSDYGNLSTKQSNLITLQKVSAVITLKNSPPIRIFSDSALYNSTSYNTEFYGNVIVV